MLRKLSTINGYSIQAQDGELGHVQDCYFDDEKWTIRYIVVKTGFWLFGREVLISPHSVERIDFDAKCLCVAHTQEQVKGSPDIDTHRPISRRKESEFHIYYNFPAYWGGVGLWGQDMYPRGTETITDAQNDETQKRKADDEDVHLRSIAEISGYRVRAVDNYAGSVTDFIFDETDWALRYVVLKGSGELQSGRYLISPKWIDQMIWSQATVNVNVSLPSLQSAPTYDASVPVTRELEEALFQHFTTHPYWEEVQES